MIALFALSAIAFFASSSTLECAVTFWTLNCSGAERITLEVLLPIDPVTPRIDMVLVSSLMK